ncbi:tetratricopeptide repeat protein [Mesorhizobium sp.]|uniref:tetratricopeptide repeat protein n=1 Tax=Mesorhizobium sp. TaxID=1871066 RepID=UPI000FE837FD|nr:tetratricopeptide repeat protein [Mesorhizobium sp.]RWA64666.1 MAG: sel1 repeat family protein [Mesorhizobium sp.]RWA82954.1 MAG: sel1 repeat family protein [Mesorhizobium sp.]
MSKQSPWEKEPDLPALRRAYDLITRDEVAAVSKLVDLANQGSQMSLVYLGNLYRRGQGSISKDAVEAERWFRKAADEGSLVGIFHLAIMYLNQERFLESESLLKEACNREYPPAIYWLGRLYWRGPNVMRDLSQARSLLERAADKGHIWASRDLARGYVNSEFGFKPLRSARFFLRGAVKFMQVYQSDPKSQRLRRDGAWAE